ncbi:hypothetical protein B0H12DRAFT_1140020 [Mycena haematopus]|nr:hypothetical protein B0H12DRAFT_1140020 [Mycena haematopus]
MRALICDSREMIPNSDSSMNRSTSAFELFLIRSFCSRTIARMEKIVTVIRRSRGLRN